MKIGNIYVSDFDYDKYKEIAQYWDEFDKYQTFLDIAKDADNVLELQAGDDLNVCGLTMQIFSSYTNQEVEGTDGVNDGSLLFKLSAKEQSMLFCGGVGAGMTDKLIGQWGSKLQADYIQMGHHGNGGLNEDFYRIVEPSVAFFDAPDWLMYPEDNSVYTTPKNQEIMESMGSEIRSYNTAPNSVEMK